MATSLLALLDDIATVLDDVTTMTKVAAGRTAGVLGDDLALNAEQVSGVRADRELPVVWAVFKGSVRNKLILVPAALLLAAFAPFAITPLLMLGGAYLCYEGFEKIAAPWLHPDQKARDKQEVIAALHNPQADLAGIEKEKIRGAIRTDFVLSAEIIVIAMGTVQESAFATQVGTVVLIATLMTLGVYGLVAGIVRLDDLGLHLARSKPEMRLRIWWGERILDFAPMLMKGLSIVGTAAMFLVGGSILAHGVHVVDELILLAATPAEAVEPMGWLLAGTIKIALQGIFGIICGGLIVPVIAGIKKLMPKKKAPQ